MDQQKNNRIIQEFELWKLCSKYIIVKGTIKNFELFTNSNYISSNWTSLSVEQTFRYTILLITILSSSRSDALLCAFNLIVKLEKYVACFGFTVRRSTFLYFLCLIVLSGCVDGLLSVILLTEYITGWRILIIIIIKGQLELSHYHSDSTWATYQKSMKLRNHKNHPYLRVHTYFVKC